MLVRVGVYSSNKTPFAGVWAQYTGHGFCSRVGVYPELYGTSLTYIESLNGGVICQVRNRVAGTPAKICLACFCLRESCLQPYWVLTSCIDSLPPTCVDKT